MANYGVLCGLRSDEDSDTSASTTPVPSLKDEHSTVAATLPTNHSAHRRPQSLTLPFDNRARESHLMSDEEFDRIVRRAELDNPLPALPSGSGHRESRAGLRRSISTARDTRHSMMSLRPRPMSADFEKLISSQGIPHDRNHIPPSTLPRDPTLTALPRHLTQSDLPAYPLSTRHTRASSAFVGSSPKAPATVGNGTTQDMADALRQGPQSKKGHKRNFSTAAMVELVKKRLKHDNSAAAPPQSSSPSKLSMSVSNASQVSPAASTQSRSQPHPPVHPNNDMGMKRDIKDPELIRPTKPSDHQRISLLKRTWSRTKHAAKLSISLPSPKHNAFEPLPTVTSTTPQTQRTPGTPTPNPSVTTTNTAPSPTLSQHTPTTTPSTAQDRNLEYISGPQPRKKLLTRLGVPASRAELNTVVARQQSRIQDLTLQNDVMLSQIERLRDQVQGLKMGSEASSLRVTASGAGVIASSVGGEEGGCELGGRLDRDCVRGRESMGRAVERDGGGGGVGGLVGSGGWRGVMGVKEAGNFDGRVDADDRRKTWMTCDS